MVPYETVFVIIGALLPVLFKSKFLFYNALYLFNMWRLSSSVSLFVVLPSLKEEYLIGISTTFKYWNGKKYKVRISGLTATSSLVDIDRRFQEDSCLHHQGDEDDDAGDGGSKLLWNVGQYLPDYTVQHPRREPSSDSRLFSETVSRFILDPLEIPQFPERKRYFSNS
jgi:hypothetical protein